VKLYEKIGERSTEAIKRYVQEVKSSEFPVDGQHTYPISREELEKFEEVVKKRKERQAPDI
jgi:hypothetical protein